MKISVIVAVYNTQKFLEQCLNSLVNQTFKELEIICINDGSTDKSAIILNRYPQINVIHQENKGPSSARNRGIEEAKGEYIAFVDSDDWVDLDYFEKLYNAILECEADIACASILRTRNKYRIKYNEQKVYSALKDKLFACDYPNCSYVWNKLYKAELVKSFRFKDGVYFEDVIWTPEVLRKSQKIVVVPNTNYHYRKNSSSIVKTLPSNKKQEDLYNAKKYAIEFFKKNKIKLEEKAKYITRNKYYFCNVLMLKIKEYEHDAKYYLFGFLNLLSIQDKSEKITGNCLGIKFNFYKNKLSNKQIIEQNLPYEQGLMQTPVVINSKNTLLELIQSNKSICRFGDGEFNLILGEDIPFQKYSESLRNRLKEILVTQNDSLMYGIPDIFASLDCFNNACKKFWRKYMAYNRDKIFQFLNFDKTYYDTLVTRVYIDTQNKERSKQIFNNFKLIWDNKDIVFVEGECSRLGFGNDLFDNAKSVQRIICPAKNAYDKYDEILKTCLEFEKDKLFILALGPTATVLAYDLANSGYRALDLGHLDIEYEWFLKGAKKKIPIKEKYVNEAKNGRKISTIKNDKYEKEIVRNFAK